MIVGLSMSIDTTQPPRKGTGDEKRKITRDEQLRKRGFRIVSRRIGEQPIWQDKHGRLWDQNKIVLEDS